MYDGMFIVGIETPEGQATYHYDIEPYWVMFKVKELDSGVERIGYDAFAGCSSLTDVYFTGTEEQWAQISGNTLPAGVTLHCNYAPVESTPETETPEADVPVVEVPETPEADVPVVEVPETPEADVPVVEVPETETPEV